MIALGIDAGSSSVKCALVDIASGKTLAIVRYPEQEMQINSPHPGWAEQDPDLWWAYTCKAIGLACRAARISPDQISCIGIGYQMHGLVLVDRLGAPIRPAIIWCDSRAIASGDALANALEKDVMEQHLLNHPGNFTAAKLKWVQEFEPVLYEHIYKVMLPGDYLAYKMSGEFTTSWGGLSEGIWYDYKNQSLSADMLVAGGVDASLFPKTGNCFDVLCTTNEPCFQSTGIRPGTPVSFRAGDQPCNAFALGVLEPGQAAATGGTSGVVYVVSDQPHHNIHAGFNTFLHVNHKSGRMRLGNLLCINGTGIMYKWVRNQHFPDLTYSDMEAAAAACLSGSDGLLCLPFGNGAERMLANRNTGASFLGLDLNRHTRGHIARAALEGIAFAFAYGMERMAEAGVQVRSLRAGNDNLFQSAIFSSTLADISGVPINMYHTTGAAGAAMGAAYGAGFIGSPERVGELIEHIGCVEPGTVSEALARNYTSWKNALHAVLSTIE
jgi:xylulokinase